MGIRSDPLLPHRVLRICPLSRRCLAPSSRAARWWS